MTHEELREQIAKDIEAFRDSKFLGTLELIDNLSEKQKNLVAELNQVLFAAVTTTASIARGDVK